MGSEGGRVFKRERKWVEKGGHGIFGRKAKKKNRERERENLEKEEEKKGILAWRA